MELESKQNDENSGINMFQISGLTSVLYDTDYELITTALEQLLEIVDSAWAEISDSLPQIVVLSKSNDFSNHCLASYLASKCFFNLKQYEEAFKYALDSDKYFDFTAKNEYTETMIITCLEMYTNYIKTKTINSQPLDSRIQMIINYIFSTSLNNADYLSIVGTALDCQDIDIAGDVLLHHHDLSLLFFIENTILHTQLSQENRIAMLQKLNKFYQEVDPHGYFYALYLYKYSPVEELLPLLLSLLQSLPLVAYQLALDFYTINDIPKNQEIIAGIEKEQEMTKKERGDNEESDYEKLLSSFLSLLKGILYQELSAKFLSANNHYDNIYVNRIINNIPREPSLQGMAIFCLTLMNHGTNNSAVIVSLSSKWMQSITEWSAFFVVAGLSQLYKYQLSTIYNIYSRYLEKGQDKEGGALMGLGTAFMNNYERAPDLLKKKILENINNSDEYVAAGASLAFGSVFMNTNRGQDGYDALYNNVNGDNTIVGMCSGVSLGMYIYNHIDLFKQDIYAKIYPIMQNTKHEQIVLGLGIGLALAVYKQEQRALPIINMLMSNRTPLIRYCGVYMYATAFAGTGDKEAVKQILHIMVSDKSTDVHRACPFALYLVMAQEKQQLLSLLLPLLHSYCPHIRYSAILSLGYLLGDTYSEQEIPVENRKEAIETIWKAMEDREDMVHQAVYISLGFIYMNKNTFNEPKITEYRDSIVTILKKSNGLSLTNNVLGCIGALVGAGIIDCGGRNECFSLSSSSSSLHINRVFSLVLFQQFWYWHPFLNYSLQLFTPSITAGISKSLTLPASFTVVNNTPLSHFDYFPAEKSNSDKDLSKLKKSTLLSSKKEYVPTIVQSEEKKEEVTEKPKEEEPTYKIKNGERCIPMQYSHITIPSQRYMPLVQSLYKDIYVYTGGFFILEDTNPSGAPEDAATKEELVPSPSTPPTFTYTIPSPLPETNNDANDVE